MAGSLPESITRYTFSESTAVGLPWSAAADTAPSRYEGALHSACLMHAVAAGTGASPCARTSLRSEAGYPVSCRR